MAFTYRTGLGRPLTWEEMDDNLAFIEQLEQQAQFAAQGAATARDDAEGFRDDAVTQTTAIKDDAVLARNAAEGFAQDASGFAGDSQTYAAAAQAAAGIPALVGQGDKWFRVKVDESGVEWAALAAVASSGSYADLSGTPTIPTVPGVATPSADGLMSSDDKTKLNAVGTMANRDVIISTSDPSGSYPDGTIWIKV